MICQDVENVLITNEYEYADFSRMYLPLENVLMIWWLKKPGKQNATDTSGPQVNQREREGKREREREIE